MISPKEIMKFVHSNELGGKNNPISNENDLLKAIQNKKNCCMYTKGTFLLPQCILSELEFRNIELFGENYLTFSKQLEKEILEGNTKNDMIPAGMLKVIVKDVKPTSGFQVNKNNNFKKYDFTFDELYKNIKFEIRERYIIERKK